MGLLHRRLDREEAHEVGGLLDVVDDVVELGGEGIDVGAVESLRGVEIETPDYVLRDPVALLLGLENVAGHPALLRPCVEHVLEQLRPPQDVGACLGERVEIDRVSRLLPE